MNMSTQPSIVIFDNYDSFTYNLVHLVEYIQGYSVTVVRNDVKPLDYFDAFDKILLSPGPGIPEEAGLLLPLIERYAATKSILGVCLGHQAIGQHFGGKLTNLDAVYHGLATPIQILKGAASSLATGKKPNGDTTDAPAATANLFAGLPTSIQVGRYHSWVVDQENLPDCLRVTAVDANGLIMALEHKELDVQGVQFHPESILTPDGETLMRNWLQSV
jgi:anthranilate synthase component II